MIHKIIKVQIQKLGEQEEEQIVVVPDSSIMSAAEQVDLEDVSSTPASPEVDTTYGKTLEQ